MAPDRDATTSRTLLLRLRDLDNNEAWKEFHTRYEPRIMNWCRRYNLQESDALDVTQEVLGKLVRAMQTFEYQPARGSFRGWLKTVTNNAIRDFLKTLSRPGRGSGDTQTHRQMEILKSEEALSALASTIEEEGERELLREAEQRVKARVQPHTWQAYKMTVLESCKSSEAAEKLQIPVSDVYVAKSRVIKLLRQEVENLNKSPQFNPP